MAARDGLGDLDGRLSAVCQRCDSFGDADEPRDDLPAVRVRQRLGVIRRVPVRGRLADRVADLSCDTDGDPRPVPEPAPILLAAARAGPLPSFLIGVIAEEGHQVARVPRDAGAAVTPGPEKAGQHVRPAPA